MIYKNKELQIMRLKNRINKLMQHEVQNENLIRKAKRKIRSLQNG